MKITLLLLLFTLCASSSAQHTGMNAPKEEQSQYTDNKFKAHMLFHFNEGCPTNSECSPEMGRIYGRWSKAVAAVRKAKKQRPELEPLRSEYGAPVDLWLTPKAQAKEGFIYWDSPCKNHNKEGQEKIGIGVVLAKNMNEVLKYENEGKAFIRRLYRLEDSGELKTYLSLRGENPLYFDGEKMVFKRMIEGNYYGLSIGPQGRMSIVDTITPPEFPQTIECPQKAYQKVKALKHPDNLYSGHYCQRAWNIRNHRFETILIGWSCN